MVVEGTHGSQYVLVNPIYNMTMGVSPALLSLIDFLKRLWDAMIDPLVGQFSDNFRSRWGRRLPLLALSILPISVLFAAMWWFPRDLPPTGLFWYLLVVSLVFYACYAFYAMPLTGLLLEATDDYHERSRIVGVTLAFGFVIQIGSQWLPWLVYQFRDASGAPDPVAGIRWVSAGCAMFFILIGLVPVLLCRERNYHRVAARQQKISLLASLRAVWGNRQFMTVLWARFIFCFCYSVVGIMVGYMNVYYVFGGDKEAAFGALRFLGSSYHVAALLTSLFFFPWLVRRIGKKAALQKPPRACSFSAASASSSFTFPASRGGRSSSSRSTVSRTPASRSSRRRWSPTLPTRMNSPPGCVARPSSARCSRGSRKRGTPPAACSRA
jgi:GPH family glycoside/pentoside/hexuronide:cation symporter